MQPEPLTTKSDAVAAHEKGRELFERWHQGEYPNSKMGRLANGGYDRESVHLRWVGWRAAYAAGLERAAQECDAMTSDTYGDARADACAAAIRALT